MKQWSTLKKLIWMRFVSAVREYSGAIVTFFTSVAKPLQNLIIHLQPIQDLHGYDHPWPGGGGKNLIPDGTDTNNGFVADSFLKADGSIGTVGGINVSEYFPVSPSTIYGWKKYENQASVSASVCFYDDEKTFISGEAYSGRTEFTITSPANAAFCRVSILVYVNPETTLFMVGNNFPETWEPYANLCPISGRTGANAYRTGKNLLATTDLENGTINAETGEEQAAANNRVRTAEPLLLKGGTYTVSCSSNTQIVIDVYGANGQFIKSESLTSWNNTNSRSITLSGDRFVRVVFRKPDNATMTVADVTDYQLEAGGVATSYDSDGTTYPVTWQTEAGTVYGGTVDVVSGVLKSRPYYPSYNGETLVGPWVSSMDEYTPGGTPTTGAQVVDLGGAETETQLTAQEVTTLVGTNNVWSDSGDVTVRL